MGRLAKQDLSLQPPGLRQGSLRTSCSLRAQLVTRQKTTVIRRQITPFLPCLLIPECANTENCRQAKIIAVGSRNIVRQNSNHFAHVKRARYEVVCVPEPSWRLDQVVC